MRSREQSWQYPPCFHEQRNSQVHFQGRSLEQPCPMQQDEPLQGWWHWPLPCSFPPAQRVALNPLYTNNFIQSKQEYFLLKVTSYQAESVQTIHSPNKPWSSLAAMGRDVSKGNHPVLWSQMSLCLQYWSLISEISPHCPSTGGIVMLQDYLDE